MAACALPGSWSPLSCPATSPCPGPHGSPVLPSCPQCQQGPQAGGALVSLHFPACALTLLNPEQMQHSESITAMPDVEQCWQMGSKPLTRVVGGGRPGRGLHQRIFGSVDSPSLPFPCRAQHSHSPLRSPMHPSPLCSPRAWGHLCSEFVQ